MTLIVAAFNKSGACVSTDTQLTNLSNGQTSSAVKSLFVEAKDGPFLFCYTANDVFAGDDTFHVADLMTNIFSDAGVGDTPIDELMKLVVNRLNEAYYYRHGRPDELTILGVGWKDIDGIRTLTTYRITNCEDNSGASVEPKRQFEVFEDNPKRGVLFSGSMRRGYNNTFDNKLKHINRLLKNARYDDFRAGIGAQLYELNTIAHNDSSVGKYIGDTTLLSIIAKRSNSAENHHFPDTKDYLVPNFSTPFMSVRGAKVHNDPVAGSTLTIDIKKKSKN